MNSLIKRTTVIIPALEPDERLIKYVNDLQNNDIKNIIVVNDGSGPEYDRIFNEIGRMGNIVLKHNVNKGKGAALKTAYKYIYENFPGTELILTADSDGQHSVRDCIKMINNNTGEKNILYLGCRDFDQSNVPFKSRFGNKLTSIIFKLFFHQSLSDTQTGLRAFGNELLPVMINIEGNRYEYEMNVLIYCLQNKIKIHTVPIETIYENNNEGTHFHPLKDSYRIYKTFFSQFFKFMGVSIICTLIDQLTAGLFSDFLFPKFGIHDTSMNVWYGGLIARFISSICNFFLNKKFVFKFNGKTAEKGILYGFLCIFIICVSNFGVTLLMRIGLKRWISKIIMDTLLYFVSYYIQKTYIFRNTQDNLVST